MDVHIHLDRRDRHRGDLSLQIYRQLLEAILDGRLRRGERLPATRLLAKRLEVSRNTVGVAYEHLTAEGVLVGRVGSGSFVSPDLHRAAPGGQRRAPTGSVAPRAVWLELGSFRQRPSPPPDYDFGVGTPDTTLFPFATWRGLLLREFRSSVAGGAQYGDPAGLGELRAAIARHAGVSRAVRADADDVIVTQGAQQAFDLIGRVLISPGTCVAVEDPGYLQVSRLFRSLGAEVVGVPVDSEGLQVDAIPKRARLVYVTPSHQFPLGTAMSLQRRAALLEWAERRNGVVVEDDYDSEFRFAGRPLDPLQTLDRAGRVVYVGSFSKVLMPRLRLGFIVAPRSLQEALVAARQLSDWYGEPATQGALARFIDGGLLARHVRRVTRVYAERAERIAGELERRCGTWLRPIPVRAGMHLAATLAPTRSTRRAIDIVEVLRRAEERGVRASSLADHNLGPASHEGIVLGFGSIPTARIAEGVRRLAECFESVAKA